MSEQSAQRFNIGATDLNHERCFTVIAVLSINISAMGDEEIDDTRGLGREERKDVIIVGEVRVRAVLEKKSCHVVVIIFNRYYEQCISTVHVGRWASALYQSVHVGALGQRDFDSSKVTVKRRVVSGFVLVHRNCCHPDARAEVSPRRCP